ncbi:MAG TPA: serine protein kinase PrkA [Polyangiaceae bacterium]|nr:serine protein kinase PrkA [Polyangiaceae bacterium]
MSEQDRVTRARSGLEEIHQHTEGQYREGRRVLSFDEYLELFAKDPVRHGRDASRYLRDVFDHYGTREVVRPWGKMTRFRLFDLSFEAEESRRRDALIGQEAVQQEIYRVLSNFAREGRANRLVLLHGPNGSAKSTVVACMMRALEHYSMLDEGALYRFHWVFPSQKTVRGAIGFGGEGRPANGGAGAASYAHLDESQIDARLFIEIRDHPLFLLPPARRRTLLHELFADAGAREPPPEWLLGGRLAHKSQQVLEALLTTYRGSLREALRHVQVERYFLSHRYRVGAVTIGPQMSVDAGERQITADRSLAALPTALQAITMFEAHGELVEAQGGLLEYSDLLKRPIDTFKYLQISVETGEVSLAQQNVHLNCVMVGSANEVHLDAFREHPEYPSFRGRFELVRAPYLLSYLDEQAIYDQQIVPQITKPVAPHVTRVAAMFAVLTRMRRPQSDKFSKALAPIVSALTAWEKMDLYATGAVPERLDPESSKHLRAAVATVYAESDVYPLYEGRVGASPREMRVVLLNAAQSPLYDHLSPLAVLDEIEDLCSRRAEFTWLQEKVQPGGYHDFKAMRDVVRERLYDAWEEEMRQASGLVEEALYADLFERYVAHVGVWVKNEKIRNRLTGAYEEPDVNMMGEVERLIGVTGDPVEFRRGVISGIAAWAIDHPGQKIVASDVFPQHLRKMRAAVFAERRGLVAAICRDLVRLLRDGGAGLDPARQKVVREVLARLRERFGYVDSAALDAASALVRWRFHELVV